MKALFDTNILIDFLGGAEPARAEVANYEDPAISIITWMEVMVGAPPEAAQATRAFLSRFQIIPLDGAVADEAVALRQRHGMKRPDAIVWASARVDDRLLVTRDTKAFPASDPGVRLPYRL